MESGNALLDDYVLDVAGHGRQRPRGASCRHRGRARLPAGLELRHHDSQPERRPLLLAAIASGEIVGGYAADDGACLLFRGTRPAEAVASRPTPAPTAWRGRRKGVIEDPLEVRHLAAPPRDLAGAAPFAVSDLRRARVARLAGESGAGLGRTYGRD